MRNIDAHAREGKSYYFDVTLDIVAPIDSLLNLANFDFDFPFFLLHE